MAAPVRKNRAILLRFPGFAYHFAKYHLQRGEIPHCPILICLIPCLFFNTLPAQLISGMNRQLLEEDPLCQTTSHPEGMQHVDFTIVMRQPLDELRFLGPTR